jgi:hypothetical protein
MATGKLMIGWHRGDITPPRNVLVQGQFHRRISDGVISPLTATALALEVCGDDGSVDQVVFLSCDLCSEGFKADLLRELGDRCAGLDTSKLTVNTTHTHNGPSLTRGVHEEPEDDPEFMNPDEYRLWLAVQLADIVATAWEIRQPGGMARGFGYAVVGRCRRAVYADGSAQMYGETDRDDFVGFESCDDHAVNFLFTRNEADKLTGIVVNLACPSQCQESLTSISADYWHDVREAVAARYGTEVGLLPQCAPAGDLSPHLLADRTEERDLRDRLGVDDKGVIARRIVAALDEALATASSTDHIAELVHEVRTFRLPRLMVTREQYDLEKRIPAMSAEERSQQAYAFQRIWPFGPVCDLITRYERQEDNPTHEVEAHIIRIGEVVFATSPFELFVDYGMAIRSRSGALQTFLVQLADGSGNGFYLPTQRALDHGHYSALIKSNWVGPEGGAMLVDESVGAINSLFEGAPYQRTR